MEQLLRQADAIADDIVTMEMTDVAGAYERLQERCHQSRRHVMLGRLMRYAAILALPLLLSTMVLAYLHFTSSQADIRFAEVKALDGTVVRFELPDSSVVWLNAGSQLRYPISFDGDKREVALQGEGYFEVKANREHPFYVHTPSGMSVYVYGTHFNVQAYDDSECIETSLEEGRLNVILPNKGQQLTLRPGEYVSYNKLTCQAMKSTTDVEVKTAWRKGELIFRNATLDEVFKALSRRFNVDISYRNHTNRDDRYRATFHDETLPQILDYLSKSTVLTWKYEPYHSSSTANKGKRKVLIDLY